MSLCPIQTFEMCLVSSTKQETYSEILAVGGTAQPVLIQGHRGLDAMTGVSLERNRETCSHCQKRRLGGANLCKGV
jgi:hypothetical protein